ncbi:MAG: GNAT family N-acetyltransferase [Balneola sp.]
MLVSGKVKLSKIEKAHSGELCEIANNYKIWINLRDVFPHPYTLEDAKGFIDFVSSESPPLTFGIFFEDHLAGVVGITPFSDVNRIKAEVGFWIGEPFWGKGIGTTALELMCEYAFQKLEFIRLEAFVFDHNKSSTRVLEKNGFSLDARLEKSAEKNGVIIDQLLYSKIKPGAG